MLNQVVLVGRLYAKPILNETEAGKKITNIVLAVPRSFKNVNGEYDTDFIKCTLWSGVAESTVEYCNKGDVIGVKGRMASRKREENEDAFHHTLEVVAEKVTFLSSKNKDD